MLLNGKVKVCNIFDLVGRYLCLVVILVCKNCFMWVIWLVIGLSVVVYFCLMSLFNGCVVIVFFLCIDGYCVILVNFDCLVF